MSCSNRLMIRGTSVEGKGAAFSLERDSRSKLGPFEVPFRKEQVSLILTADYFI